MKAINVCQIPYIWFHINGQDKCKNWCAWEVNIEYNNVWLQRIQNVLRYFPHETKATRREDLRMENEPCRWSFVYRKTFIGRASSGRDRILRLKLTPSCSLSLCSARKSRASLKLGLLQKARSHNIWPSFEDWTNTSSNLWRNSWKSEATRKELRASNNTEQTSNNRRTSPEWRHATTTRRVSNIRETKDRSASFQLKSK